MTFEYIVEKDKTKKLNADDLTALASAISSDFDNYNARRQRNLEMAEALTNEIFFKVQPKKNEDKYEKWKTKVKMCKTYMFYQTIKAFIWKNVYANPSSMFDVSGENQEADNDSNKEKSMLVDKFERMEYPKTCDRVVDYSLLHGELVSYTAWRKKDEEYRKVITPADMLKPAALKAVAKGKKHFIDTREIYNDPYVHPVNPANFVFDVTQEDNWDSCPKIYRSWKTPEDIINNKYYTVSKEVAEELRNKADKEVDSNNSQLDSSLDKQTKNGKTIEVLEHWGDYTMKDGTVLRNWHIVVVDRKHVIRFDKNNRIINPFSFACYVRDPETGRGISILYCVLSLALMQEDLMNRTCDMQALSENPPIYAPEGFFDEEEVKLYPGKIIEFGDSLSPSQIQQMQFSVSVFLNDVTFLSDIMSEVSGIFPNMAGADEAKAKTATEISTKAQGQLTRLSMLIDTINQGLIIPNVKKVAKLCADFKTGDETIYINKGNDKETITITDKIRQAQYRFTYSDRTATTERSNKADLTVSACERFAQFIPLNVQELFTWYMEQKDVENPERFLQQQPQMPQELQNMLLQNPQIQQMAQAIEMQKQNGEEVPAQIPDASIPQAQPME